MCIWDFVNIPGIFFSSIVYNYIIFLLRQFFFNPKCVYWDGFPFIMVQSVFNAAPV